MRGSTGRRVGLTAASCLAVFLAAGAALGHPAELLRNINTGNADSKARPRIVIGDTLFFTADDGIHGTELWATDGTTVGTRMVADLWPGRASSWPSSFVELAGTLFFTANDGEHGYELWRSEALRRGPSWCATWRPAGLAA